jgi:hypothetical protein
VSSILRALKKLEDAPADQNGVAPWQAKFTNQHTRHRQSRRTPLRSTTAIVAAVAVLAVVGWLANRGPQLGGETAGEPAGDERMASPPEQPSAPPRPASSPASPEMSVANQPPAALPPVLVERLAAAQQTKLADAHGNPTVSPEATTPMPRVTSPPVTLERPAPDDENHQTDVATLAAGTSATPAAKVPEEPVLTIVASPLANDVAPPAETPAATWHAPMPRPPATSTPIRRDVAQAVAHPARATTPVVTPSLTSPVTQIKPTETTTPPAPILNRLRDTAIKLQAIAWSNDPERRMAMINEQIVHEGQTIEGYTIAAIGEESVTMRKGNEAWELRYGH